MTIDDDITTVQHSGRGVKRSAYEVALLVVVPFYKAEDLVEPLVASLVSVADEISDQKAELVLINDSPGYMPLAEELDKASRKLQEQGIRHRLVKNVRNLGFVGTVNTQLELARNQCLDVLLVNSDTVVFPGAISELAAVAALDHMIGFVSPRSNNATICSLPGDEVYSDVTPPEGFENFRRLAEHLPRVSYVPTCVGFCLFIKGEILAEFGIFDEVYGGGYNEENDLICRAGEVGYRAVLANKAFVWHRGEQSFSKSDTPKSVREAANREILTTRYPHYERRVQSYFSGSRHLTEQVLAGLLPDRDGTIRVAFDFSSFGLHHNGTFEAGIKLLNAVSDSWGSTYSFTAICSQEVFDFHRLDSITGLKRSPIHSTETFAAVLRIGQPFDWSILQMLFRRSPVVLISMLDTISQDCASLYEASLDEIWAFTGENADIIASISEYSMAQYTSRYNLGSSTATCPSLLSVDKDDYLALEIDTAFCPQAKQSIFVVGNHFPHKGVLPTLEKLLEELPNQHFVTIGSEYEHPRVTALSAGHMTDAEVAGLYRSCRLVVFPSYYEGFGLPILHALAHEKPVFARKMPVFEEIKARTANDPNIHLFETTDQLVSAVGKFDGSSVPHPAAKNEGWKRSALELQRAVETGLQNIQFEKIEHRLSLVMKRAAEADIGIRTEYGIPNSNVTHNAARFVGIRAEHIATKIFENRFAYRLSRKIFHTLRRLRGQTKR